MKKIFFLLTASLITLGCNSDDDTQSNNEAENPVQTENVLLKKLTNTALMDSDGSTETYVVEFEYNSENKLSKIIRQDGYTEFEYQNGKIANYTNYSEGGNNSSGELIYEGDKLTHTIANDSGYIFRIDYIYSNDGKLQKTKQCSGTEPCPDTNSYTEYTFQNDNITQEIRSSAYFGEPWLTTYSYTFDDKKNPFLNYDEPTRILLNDIANSALNKNNYT